MKYETEGLGYSKKDAKKVAFMKIHPLILKFYDPDINLDELRSIHFRKHSD